MKDKAAAALEERNIDLAVLLARLEGRMSDFVAQLRGMAVNDVLASELATIGSTGIWSRDWEVPFAAVAVANFGPSLVLTSDPPQGQAPSGGPGAHRVGNGGFAVLNITGRTVTLYGVAGAQVSLQVFTKPQPPAAGLVGRTSLPVPLTGANQAVAVVPTGLGGFTLRETTGTTPATVVFWDSATAGAGTILETVQLAPGESRSEAYPSALTAAAGVFVTVTGAVQGSARLG